MCFSEAKLPICECPDYLTLKLKLVGYQEIHSKGVCM